MNSFKNIYANFWKMPVIELPVIELPAFELNLTDIPSFYVKIIFR